MKINNSLISAGCFVLTLFAFVGLQFAPHMVGPTINEALFSIMGLALGHALGASTASGTVAHIVLPGTTDITGSKAP